MVHDQLTGALDEEWELVDAPDDWRLLTPLGPGGRPMARWRPLVAVLALAALLALVLMMLSDRAPDLLGEVSVRVAVRIDDRVPQARESLFAAVSGTPAEERDVQVHVALWAVVMFLLGLVSWSWRSLAAIAVLVLGAATTLELLQERLAPTRLTEEGDLIANAAGIAIGLIATVIVTEALGIPARVRQRAAEQEHR